jgi:hypothetical protein
MQSFINRDFPLNRTGIGEMTARKSNLLELQKKLDTPLSLSGAFSTLTVESFHDYDQRFQPLTLILFHAYTRRHICLASAKP